MANPTQNTASVSNSSLELHSADLANFECSQTPSLVSHSKFAKNYESQTENPSVVLNSKNGESTNLPQQTIEGIAVEVLDLEKNLGAKLDLESVSLPNFSPSAKDAPKSELKKDDAQNPKFRSIIVGASGLSLGISIVVAILLGIGAGVLMQKIFDTFWVLFLGVFWGIAAAVLNVYKVYKAELRDFENLANDPKYKNMNPK